MAKLTAWLVTLIGIVWLLPLLGITILSAYQEWVIGVSFLVIGIGKLVRNYKLTK